MSKLLIMVDDEGLLEVLEAILSHKGFRVITTLPNINIVDLVVQHSPDLVIIDFLMGQICGGELCLALKGNMFTQNVPVIILAAPGKKRQSQLNYGCNLVFSKPIDFENLIEHIRSLNKTANSCIFNRKDGFL